MRRQLLLVLSWGLPVSGFAAQVYVQPTATITAEYDSNLDMETSGARANEGNIIDASALFGISTPTSDTNLQPQVLYDDYPRETSLNRVQGLLDFNSRFSTQRSSFSIYGRLEYLNEIVAELPTALYNNVNPPSPTSPQTGQVNSGVTRQNVYVVPKYTLDLTQRSSVGASGVFQRISFSVTNPFYLVDFDYEEAQLFIAHNFSPRTSVTLGAYGAHYEATTIDSNATSDGATADYDYRWSQLARFELSMKYQHSNIDAVQPIPFRGNANTLGADLSGVWQWRISQLRFDVGRIVTPSGGGGLYVNDQVQGEYDRNLSERLSFTGALLYTRSRGLTANVRTFNRDYGQALLSLKWMMTRTFFLQGGASFTSLHYYLTPGTPTNDRVFVTVGYQGLPPQR